MGTRKSEQQSCCNLQGCALAHEALLPASVPNVSV